MTESTPVRPARERRGSGIQRFVWMLWPWMNWLLPIAAIFVVGNSGWFLLLLLVVALVLVLVLGLLGTIPQFLLGNEGWKTAPAPVAVLLIVQWWAWIAALVVPQGATYGRPVPSIVQLLSPRPVAGDFLVTVLVASVSVGVLCWVAVLILSIILRRRSGSVSPGRGWTRGAVVAAIVPPVLLVAVIWSGGEVTAQQRDDAGATVAETAAEPLREQAARALDRYESAQSQLSEIRGMLADDGWWLTSRGFDSRSSWGSGADAYGFDLGFEYEFTAGEAPDVDTVHAELLTLGWSEDERGRLVDPHGNTVLMWADSRAVSVSLTSPSWWGDTDELSDELDRGVEDDAFGRPYAANEWPGL